MCFGMGTPPFWYGYPPLYPSCSKTDGHAFFKCLYLNKF